MNSASMHAINLIYRHKQRKLLTGMNVTLENTLFPIHSAQSYFKLFGVDGFHEYQALLPAASAFDYLDSVQSYLRRQPLTITLASAKVFAGSHELLRFTGDGVCLALNFPRGKASGFMNFLDDRVIALGGIPNIIKDSRLPRTVVDACYPGADEFRTALRDYDPKRLFRSELSERLGL